MLEIRGKKRWETVHPRAPAVQILSPQPSCPNTPGPAPLFPCSGCLGPSFLASFFLLTPTPPPCLPGVGEGGPGEEGATERVRMGEGNSPEALTALQPQPPHPHDLHREGTPGGGGEGQMSCVLDSSAGFQAPASK